jgi:6-phosphogluconate dehydrogenase
MNISNGFEIGIVGLGTMGRNLLLNIAEHGFSVMGLDKDISKVQLIQNEAKLAAPFDAASDVITFLQKLRKPRAIVLLVPAGGAVDSVLLEISPLLSASDVIVDTGNSHFKDTDRREKEMREKGLHFFGMGVSGGEVGARKGPSLMPGGDKAAYERVRPILEAIAARVNGEPCVTYLGPGAAGHYVKMVHNGIEYALMQLISESYAMLKIAFKKSNDDCHKIYQEWNQTELASYLLEITAQIFLKQDDKTDQRMIDKVRDVAKQKGTGMWTCEDAMELQIPVPTISAAVAARDLSALEEERKSAQAFRVHSTSSLSLESAAVLIKLKNAFYASSIIAYGQGMAVLQKASSAYHFNLDLKDVVRIWRGGCIIRAAVLEPIMTAYHNSPKLSNLLLDSDMAKEVARRQEDLREIIQVAIAQGIPVPALTASLAYFDGFQSSWLPANLIQAQRDFFGAHTYERTDQDGIFHSKWEEI